MNKIKMGQIKVRIDLYDKLILLKVKVTLDVKPIIV